MKRPHALIAALMLWAIGATNSLASPKAPYEIVRSIQALHDQMALGSHAAQAAMPGVLRKLAGRLMAAPATAWADPRNTRAIVVYILSGGEIRVAEKVLESRRCAPLERRLIEGALAYLEGDRGAAKGLLESIDVRTLEPAVGSHIALAQAALLADSNPAKAIVALDVARILAPGTLIEDAALRREVFLAERTDNFDKFVAMSEEYLRRFRRSVYAESFRRSILPAIVHMSLLADAQARNRLADLLNGLGPREQLRSYLEIARASLLAGKLGSTRWASSKAIALAAKNSQDARRATLYNGAASVLTSDYDRGLGELEELKSKSLSHADARLAEAAIGVAKGIREWPKTSVPPAGAGALASEADKAPSPPADTKEAVPAALAATIGADEATIAQAEQLLAKSGAVLDDSQ